MSNSMGMPAGFRLLHLVETGSTNDDCLAAAQAGEDDGLVIVADLQKKGRGRQGRSWHAKAGSSLVFTLLIRPSAEEQAYIGRFTALGGLALVATLKKHYGIESALKWPNDVLIRGRKVSGILAETVWRDAKAEAVALGMGVNLHKGAVPEIERLVYPATSIESESGQVLERWAFLGRLLESLQEIRQQLAGPSFIEQWNENLAFKGEVAAVRDEDGQQRAYRVLAVQNDGGLLVSGAAGLEKVLHSAEFIASN